MLLYASTYYRMKKLLLRLLALSMFLAGLALWAADVWVAKPYTEWTAKDVDKIMSDSPWAKQVSVTLDLGRGGGSGSAGGAPSPDVDKSGGPEPGRSPTGDQPWSYAGKPRRP